MSTHTGEKPFTCSQASNEDSESPRELCLTCEKLYSCSQCNKSYAHRCTMKTHMMSHTCQKPYSDMMEGSKVLSVKGCKCENTSLEIIEMADKQSTHCSADNCKFNCNYKTKQPNSNGKIEQKPKVNKTTYACSICMQSFLKQYRLKAHMRKHTKEKPFTCTVCSKPFSQISHLSVHLRIHRGEKPFSCLICKKLFLQGSHLKNHMRTHSGDKPFSCSYCNKSFTQSFSLKAHILSHTGGTGEKYSCSQCNKSYLLKNSLRKHILSHSRETLSCNKSTLHQEYNS